MRPSRRSRSARGHLLGREHDDRHVGDERIGVAAARRPRTRPRPASAGRAARPPGARGARARRPPRRPRRAATDQPSGREHRLDEVEVERVVVDHHNRSPVPARRRRSARARRAARRGSTGLTRYSAAPSANPAPRSSSIDTITTGIAAVAGSRLSCAEQLPAVQPRKQDVEDHRRRASSRRASSSPSTPSRADGRPRSRRPPGRRGSRSAERRSSSTTSTVPRGRGSSTGSADGRERRRRSRAPDGPGSRTRTCCRRRRSLSIHSRPPCSSTIRRDSVSPRPVPSVLAARRAAAALEGLEDPLALLLGDADPRVAHADVHLARCHAPRVDRDRPAVRRELDRVAEQVEHHLLELQLVARHRADLGRHVQLQRDALALGALAHHRDAVLEQLARASTAPELELHPPGLDLRQVEDLVDELEQMAPRVADVADVLLLALVELAEHAVQQHVGEADHRVERRAQLVRHAGEELRLVPARRPRAARTCPRARGRRGRCGSPPPTGSRASRAGRPSAPARRPAACAGRSSAPTISSSRRSGTATIERQPWRRSSSMCASGGSRSRSGRLPGLARGRRPPDERLVDADADIAQRIDELPARADARAQHELAGRPVELEDRSAVGAGQLDRSRHDRREHLVEVEARADRLADLAERAQLLHRACRARALRSCSSWKSRTFWIAIAPCAAKVVTSADRPLVERVDLAAPERDDADDAILGEHRHAEHRPEAAELPRLLPLVARIGHRVGYLDRAPLEPDESDERARPLARSGARRGSGGTRPSRPSRSPGGRRRRRARRRAPRRRRRAAWRGARRSRTPARARPTSDRSPPAPDSSRPAGRWSGPGLALAARRAHPALQAPAGRPPRDPCRPPGSRVCPRRGRGRASIHRSLPAARPPRRSTPGCCSTTSRPAAGLLRLG